MNAVLWVVMLAFAAVAWGVQRPERPLWLRIIMAVAHAAFLVWAVVTSIETLGAAWIITAAILGIAVAFREEIEKRFAWRTR